MDFRLRFSPVHLRAALSTSEKFLSQRDDDARRAAHVAEPVLVLVLDHLANEFGAVGSSQFRRWNRAHSRRFASAEPYEISR